MIFDILIGIGKITMRILSKIRLYILPIACYNLSYE